jgi:hypothetical protein
MRRTFGAMLFLEVMIFSFSSQAEDRWLPANGNSCASVCQKNGQFSVFMGLAAFGLSVELCAAAPPGPDTPGRLLSMRPGINGGDIPGFEKKCSTTDGDLDIDRCLCLDKQIFIQ